MSFIYGIFSQIENKEIFYLLVDIFCPIILAFCCWKISKDRKTATVAAALLLVFILLRMMLARFPNWEYYTFSQIDYMYFNTWHYIFFFGFSFCVVRHLPRKTTKIAIVAFASFLYLLNIAEIVWVLDRKNIPCRNQIGRDGVCQQSTEYNCAAASCVTLLSLYNIDSNEQEMVDLCLTQRRRGTFFLGAIRGLKLKSQIHGYEAVIESIDYQNLLKINKPGLVSIELSPRLYHMVCLMEINDEGVIIGDPLSGKRPVSKKEFIERSRGLIVYLKK